MKRKISFPIAIIVILFLGLACDQNRRDNVLEPGHGAARSLQRVTGTMKMIVPAYWVTTHGNWLTLTAEAGLYPNMIYAIINTASSGPGGSVDNILLQKIVDFRNAGGKVLVYVNTWDYPTFTKIPEATVKSDVDKWYSWYVYESASQIDGVFFDQVYPYDGGEEQFYRNLYVYVKGKDANDIVVCNAGGNTSENYVEWNGDRVSDVICTFENVPSLIDSWPFQPWQQDYSYDRFYLLFHTTSTASQMRDNFEEALDRDFGWFYSTSGVMPMPWDIVPPYMAEMCSLMNAHNGGSDNRAPITVDGNASDWSEVSALATGTTSVQSLKATSDGGSLYILVQGTDMDGGYPDFLFDTDNDTSTGYNMYSWATNGCDMLIENNYLYDHNGGRTSWSWTQLTALGAYVRNSTVIELSIPLATMGLEDEDVICIGFTKSSSQTERLPMEGGTLPSYTIDAGGGGGGDTEAPTAPTSLSASNIDSNSVDLSWNASTDNVAVTGYVIYKNSTYSKTVTSGTSTTMSGLEDSTAYSFYVKARDAAGNVSGSSNTVNVTTLSGSGGGGYSDITVDGSASDWSTISALATGTYDPTTLKVTNDASTLYILVQGSNLNTGAYPDFLIDSDNNTSTGYTNSYWSTNGCDNLIENQYFYDHNTSGWSWTNQVTLSQYQRNSSVIELAVPLTTIGLTLGNTIKVGFMKDFSSTHLLPDNGQSMPSYTITSDGGGGGGDTEAPTTPTGLDTSNVTDNSVGLSWNASTDNVAVTGYNVYQDGTYNKTVTGTSTTMSDLIPSTQYSFYVRAVDAAGNASGNSSTVNATTTDTEAPTTPTGLVASNVTSSSVDLSWNASTDNVEVTGYDIYRNSTYNKTVTSTLATMLGLSANTSYNFYVIAVDAAENESDSSNHVNKTTLSSGGGDITVDGSASDWSGVSTLSSGASDIEVLKVSNDETKVYFLIQGDNLTTKSYGNFYLDTDNNTGTGYNATDWATNGCDYMIENNLVYMHYGSGWSWTLVATLTGSQYVENSSVIEVEVPLSTLGIYDDVTFGVGYMQDNSTSNRLPAQYASLPTVSISDVDNGEEEYPSIAIDGSASDWSSISTLSSGGSNIQVLKVANSESNLYILIQGSSLTSASYGNFYLDTDNNTGTGYNATDWATNGCDYMIENNLVYMHTGSGWSWTLVATLTGSQYVENISVIEVSVPLSTLGINNTATIGVGYMQDNSTTNRLPAQSASLPTKVLLH